MKEFLSLVQVVLMIILLVLNFKYYFKKSKKEEVDQNEIVENDYSEN